MACCGGRRFCLTTVSKLCWQFGLSFDRMQNIDGQVYAFVLTESDGTKLPFKYGRDFERYLLKKAKNGKAALAD